MRRSLFSALQALLGALLDMSQMALTWNSANKSLTAVFVALLAAFTLLSGLRAYGPSSFSVFSIPRHAICGTPSSIHAVNFTQRNEYWDLTAAGDAVWADILPDNGGFVPHRDSNGHAYLTGISMFHQLHCLQMIRMAVQKLENSTHSGSARDVHDHHAGDQRHWVHCLDYLVQVCITRFHHLKIYSE